MTKEEREEKEDIEYLANAPYGDNGESIEEIAARFKSKGYKVERNINLKAGHYNIDLSKKNPDTGEVYKIGFSWTGDLLGIAKHKRWKNLKCFPELSPSDEKRINKDLKEELQILSEELSDIAKNTK